MRPRRRNCLSQFARLNRRLARSQRLSLLVVGLTSLVISVAASAARWPFPSIHDEFSYLLMADTFAEGRLTNATHPAWKSMESFHIIHQPTYASKYPPAQGLILAAGQVGFGHPIFGVWLATAVASMAICWMLRGWVPPRWALWGGLLFTLQGGVQFIWGQSYWGGCAAVTGSAMLLGAAPRLLKHVSVRHALCLASGLAILANSRPFEGLLVSLPVAAWLFGSWAMRRQLLRADVMLRFVVPVSICLSLAGAAMAYYNLRITGDPLKMPYHVYEQDYSIASLFVWKEPRQETEYRHEAMRAFYQDYGLKGRREQTRIVDRLNSKQELVRFYATPAFVLPLLALPWTARSRRFLFAAVVLLLMCGSTFLVFRSHPHYFAPAAPLLAILGVRGLQFLSATGRRGGAAFRWITPGIVAFHLLLLGGIANEFLARPAPWGEARMQIETRLRRQGDRHLVLVRYADHHCAHEEWVYNRADIDAAPIVWARDMGAEANQQTTRLFPGRQPWLLEADRIPRRLMPLGPNGRVPLYSAGRRDDGKTAPHGRDAGFNQPMIRNPNS